MYFMQRRTKIVDPGYQRERKLLMADRAAFEFGGIDASSGHRIYGNALDDGTYRFTRLFGA